MTAIARLLSLLRHFIRSVTRTCAAVSRSTLALLIITGD